MSIELKVVQHFILKKRIRKTISPVPSNPRNYKFKQVVLKSNLKLKYKLK